MLPSFFFMNVHNLKFQINDISISMGDKFYMKKFKFWKLLGMYSEKKIGNYLRGKLVNYSNNILEIICKAISEFPLNHSIINIETNYMNSFLEIYIGKNMYFLF